MNINQNSGDKSHPPSFEAQQARLVELRQEITQRLFTTGVAPRIIALRPVDQDDETSVQGLAQLDKWFMPSLQPQIVDGHHEEVLSLVIIQAGIEPAPQHRVSVALGEIDEEGLIHRFNWVPLEDVEAVHREALRLERLRIGSLDTLPELPDLDPNLLSINQARDNTR